MADAFRADSPAAAEAGIRTFVQQVYGWMAAGLAVTGLVALAVARSDAARRFIFGNPPVFYGLIIGQFIVVIWLIRRLPVMTTNTAMAAFVGYSVLTGLTLSSVFLAYAEATVATAFFVTAGLFTVMTVVGFVTRVDLTRFGGILTMGLIGLIIASLVNLFLQSEGLYWLITYAGVLVFTGLVAYDSQMIRELAQSGAGQDARGQNLAIMGALRLYLDFVNLFLMLLRLFGRRR